jgi:hypothetical protein
MVRGHKEAGYFTKYDGEGRKIEGTTLQCVHCQFVWEAIPGSGTHRGYCMYCNGFICAREECIAAQKRKTKGTRYQCMPFEEEQKRLAEKLEKAGAFVISPSGIIMRV